MLLAIIILKQMVTCMDNRRKTIVINKQFQYQHSLLIVALAVVLVNSFLIARMLFPQDVFLDLSGNVTLGIGIFELLLIASIWYGSLKASHRVAGPVFVIAREIERLGKGDLTAAIHLREKDMFEPEAEAMNGSIQALRQSIDSIKSTTSSLVEAQEQGQETNSLLKDLQTQLAALNTGEEE